MSTIPAVISEAEQRFIAGDAEGFIDLFADEARFCVPGRTPISGDHDSTGFRAVLNRMRSAMDSGDYKAEVICSYAGESGAVSILDNHVVIDGTPAKYHSVHEWILRDGRPAVLLIYIHEYELFEAAWQ